MSEINLAGKPDKFGIRDAVHVAVVSLKAACPMYAGDPVIWHEKDKSVKVLDSCLSPIGIVSAFMKTGCQEGDLVWIMLYPNTVTGMTHHWSHPDFDFPAEELVEFGLTKQSAQVFVNSMAETLRVEPDYLVELATSYCGHQSGCWGNDDYQASPEDWEMFWKAYSVLTGNPRPTENRVPFRCAC